MRFITVSVIAFLTGSLAFAQTPPTEAPAPPTDLEAPTSTPPEIDTSTLTPPSDNVVSNVPDVGEKLQAISTRALVTSGDGVMINGFIIEGSGNKTVVIAGKGPSFQSKDILNTLVDPFLRLFRLESTGWVEVTTNDDWETGLSDADRTILSDNNFTPTNSLESIIVATLSAGTYGAQLEGKNGDEGVGLAEVYDFDTTSVSKITALSTRVYGGTGADTLVGGFIIDGENARTVGVRVTGPSLPGAAVSDPMADPSLQVLRYDSTSAQFVEISGATNDNWETGLSDADRATMVANSFTPANAAEPALVLTLEPGVYGGLVKGADGGVGTALIEVYDFED